MKCAEKTKLLILFAIIVDLINKSQRTGVLGVVFLLETPKPQPLLHFIIKIKVRVVPTLHRRGGVDIQMR